MDSHPASQEHGGCRHCAGGVCPGLSDKADRSDGGGRRPVCAALGIFLLPALLAIGGAVAAGRDETAQLIGALVGLGVGMAGSVLAARWIAGRRRPNA